MIFLRFAIHVEHYNRLFLGNAKETGKNLPPALPAARTPYVCARARVSTYRLMTRARAWRMIIKVSQVSRFVSTLSRFLSSSPTDRACVLARARARFVPVSTVTIYSRSSKTRCRRTIRSITPARARGGTFLFHSILYCHDNARLRRLFVRLSVLCVREGGEEGAINRGNVRQIVHVARRLYRPFFSI